MCTLFVNYPKCDILVWVSIVAHETASRTRYRLRICDSAGVPAGNLSWVVPGLLLTSTDNAECCAGQAVRLPSCRSKPIAYMVSKAYSKLVVQAAVLSVVRLITCSGEPLGSIKMQISTKGKRSIFIGAVHKMQFKQEKKVDWTKTRWIQWLPRCGSPTRQQFFQKDCKRKTIVYTVKSSAV